MKLNLFFFLPLTLILAFSLVFGKNGLLEYKASSEELQKQELLSKQYEKEQAQLRDRLDELRDPKTKAYAYETLAREKLNYVKEGETFYRFVKKREVLLPKEK